MMSPLPSTRAVVQAFRRSVASPQPFHLGEVQDIDLTICPPLIEMENTAFSIVASAQRFSFSFIGILWLA